MFAASQLRATTKHALIGALAMWVATAPFLGLSANDSDDGEPVDTIASAPASDLPSPVGAPPNAPTSAAAAPTLRR